MKKYIVFSCCVFSLYASAEKVNCVLKIGETIEDSVECEVGSTQPPCVRSWEFKKAPAGFAWVTIKETSKFTVSYRLEGTSPNIIENEETVDMGAEVTFPANRAISCKLVVKEP